MKIGRTAVIAVALLAVTVTLAAAPTPGGKSGGRLPDTGTSATDLKLGSRQAPVDGAHGSDSQPKGVPYAEGVIPSGTDSIHVVRRSTSGKHFSAVGVNWRKTQDSTISVAIRTKLDKKAKWSSWHATTAEETGGTGDRDGTGLLWTGPAVAADIAVTSVRGELPTEVRASLIDPGRRAEDTAQRQPEITLKAGSNDKVKLPIRTRAAWGANEKQMTWKPQYAPKVQAVVIHHTATTTDYSADQVPAILRSIYQYQAIDRGWGDIGYNIIVDKYGQAWEGRAGGVDKPVIGAHAEGFNTGTAGITLIGNYVTSKPTSQALDTLAKAIAYKLGPPKIDPMGTISLTGGPGPRYAKGATVKVPTVIGHETVGRTACPGKNLDAALPDLRKRAKALLSV
ncbi:MAG TPA: peptidoglycan recognition protein [Mycobacteriales bacterium]|nr:peptidoglycan recognition protein [Mycobacteriales bacterium]